MKKIINLKEKIYLLTYGKPCYKLEISDKIYKKEKKSIYPVLDNLIDEGWIIEDNKFQPDTTDGRAERRQYFRADSKPLFDSVLDKLQKQEIVLKDNEKKKIEYILDSVSFRQFVLSIMNNIDLQNETEGILLIEKELSYFCTFLLFMERYNKDVIVLKKNADFVAELQKQDSSTQEIMKLSSMLLADKSLLQHLAQLDYHTTSTMYGYFKELASLIEKVYAIKYNIKKKREKNAITNNEQGLS